MLNTGGKKVSRICTSAWQFPNFAKVFPVYSSRTIREAKVDEILSNLEERYSSNPSSHRPQSRIDDIIQDTVLVSNGREGKDSTKLVEIKEHGEGPITVCDISLEREIVKEQISERKLEESESFIEINVLEEKYFRKWKEATRKKVDLKLANLKKNVFEKKIYEHVDLEEDLWKKWKQTEIEMNEMKAILHIHWTPDSDIDYYFQYSRYLNDYKRNPLKWTDSKYSESSEGLEVKAIRRWIRIEEMYEKLKEHFLGKCKSLLQDETGESTELFYLQKQKQYLHKIIDIKRNR